MKGQETCSSLINKKSMEEYPSIKDFITEENCAVLDKDTETEINRYMEEYAESVVRKETNAFLESKRIVLDC
jgi:hypothetical protein